MKGFKLHPATGFYPSDPVCFPLYEKCAEWKVPIVFHSGGLELSWEYGQPMYIATAAERFPEVKMVMAHAGGESWPQALSAAAAIPNVYLDISTRQIDFLINSESFYRWLRNLIDWTGPWKILFASDAPLPALWLPQLEWVRSIKEPKTEVIFTREELDIMLGKAAEAVFDLT
jgi:predicted TIM-barrel fold metal-dependent hydrolase